MKPVAVVAGYLMRSPIGGHVLSILHWLVGLERLGYRVVFVEHYGWEHSCYNPETRSFSNDPAHGISQLVPLFEQFGIRDWCFIDRDDRYHGLDRETVGELCREANVMFALWTTTWIDEFRECQRRVFIDTDPGFTQFYMGTQSCAGFASPVDFHHHFTYGMRIGQPDSHVPTQGLAWRPTRPPVVLELLPARYTPAAPRFTTVMSWTPRKVITFKGETYGQKDVEFWKIASLPSRVGPKLELALAGTTAPREELANLGWHVLDTQDITSTPWTYRDYIAQSRGEFSVAVNLYVKARTGWFSDRTAAYLATGKPAIVQDTGFSLHLPCGDGLFAFSNIDDAAAAIATVDADYQRHCRAAREIAERYFEARLIISDIISQVGG